MVDGFLNGPCAGFQVRNAGVAQNVILGTSREKRSYNGRSGLRARMVEQTWKT